MSYLSGARSRAVSVGLGEAQRAGKRRSRERQKHIQKRPHEANREEEGEEEGQEPAEVAVEQPSGLLENGLHSPSLHAVRPHPHSVRCWFFFWVSRPNDHLQSSGTRRGSKLDWQINESGADSQAFKDHARH
jgi:hypothetical protein